MKSYLQRSLIFGYLTLFLSFECYLAQSSTSAPAQLIHKILHKNGLKGFLWGEIKSVKIMVEFTVQKNIKGTECACSCFCALPDAPEALNQLEGKNPESVASSFSPDLSRSQSALKNELIFNIAEFKIEKEIRGNHCKCSCACAAEPELEFVGPSQQNDGLALQQKEPSIPENTTASQLEVNNVPDATQSSTKPISNKTMVDSIENHSIQVEEGEPLPMIFLLQKCQF